MRNIAPATISVTRDRNRGYRHQSLNPFNTHQKFIGFQRCATMQGYVPTMDYGWGQGFKREALLQIGSILFDLAQRYRRPGLSVRPELGVVDAREKTRGD